MPNPNLDPIIRDAGESVRLRPQATGRKLIRFRSGVSSQDAVKLLQRSSDLPVISVSEAGSVGDSLRAAGSTNSIVVLRRFGLAAVGGTTAGAAAAAQLLSSFDEVEDTRPEFWLFATGNPPWFDSAQHTWGLDAVNAPQSAFDGAGIKLAVLDTGIDLGHPDFIGRSIVTESFVSGEAVDDLQGHGTHTAGTAAGRSPGGNVPRYGVAPGCDLHIGKVLNNQGAGRELDIIAGIEWALDQGCAIISMSLGRATLPDEDFDPIYEDIASQALTENCLIIAAAGNDSDRRYGYIAPVGSPANAPSIMAVAALGADGGPASFSNGGAGRAAIDVTAPGVGVLSSVPRPEIYRKLPGTSMACPHVAGVAALWAQSDPALRGAALRDQLLNNTTTIGIGGATIDYGRGLVRTP